MTKSGDDCEERRLNDSTRKKKTKKRTNRGNRSSVHVVLKTSISKQNHYRQHFSSMFWKLMRVFHVFKTPENIKHTCTENCVEPHVENLLVSSFFHWHSYRWCAQCTRVRVKSHCLCNILTHFISIDWFLCFQLLLFFSSSVSLLWVRVCVSLSVSLSLSLFLSLAS